MIKIYSTDAEGRLYTDPKRHYYVDSDLLREKARIIRTEYLLNQIAQRLGYRDFESLNTFLRCSGVTEGTLNSWILSGTLAQNLTIMVN